MNFFACYLPSVCKTILSPQTCALNRVPNYIGCVLLLWIVSCHRLMQLDLSYLPQSKIPWRLSANFPYLSFRLFAASVIAEPPAGNIVHNSFSNRFSENWFCPLCAKPLVAELDVSGTYPRFPILANPLLIRFYLSFH